MSSLDPELRRLFQLARRAPSPTPPLPSPEFARRVVRCWYAPMASVPPEGWRQAWAISVWGSVLVSTLAGVVFALHPTRTTTPYDFTPAYQMVARNLVP